MFSIHIILFIFTSRGGWSSWASVAGRGAIALIGGPLIGVEGSSTIANIMSSLSALLLIARIMASWVEAGGGVDNTSGGGFLMSYQQITTYFITNIP